MALVSLSIAAAPAFGGGRAVRVGVFPAAPLVRGGGHPEGLFIDMLGYFSGELGWEIEYVDGAWSDLLVSLKEGRIDLLPAVGVTAERSKIYDYSEHPVYIDSGVLFTGRRKALNTIFELRGKRVAGVKGSVFTTGFSEYMGSFGIDFELVLVEDNPSVMRAIESGDVDAGVCIYSLGTELAKKHQVRVTPINFTPIALSFAVPKGRNRDLIKGINGLMAPMLDDPGSAYSQAVSRWTEARPSPVPGWIRILLLAALAAGALLSLWAIALRKEVAAKTLHLRKEVGERLEAESRLRQTLAERETLIRELYHRTKNSLQTVSSILALQADAYPDEGSFTRLASEADSRIQAIALVHKLLYESSDLSRVRIGDYTRHLAEATLLRRGVVAGRVALRIDAPNLDVPLDTAVPFGLALNELLINSIRHAFPDGRCGSIEIRLKKGDDGSMSMSYRDDGPGLPSGFDPVSQATLGMRLIHSLAVDQLGGSLRIEAGKGFACVLDFPARAFEARA